MGTQLYHDACVPQHHKYAAHQIALLYVSVAGCGSDGVLSVGVAQAPELTCPFYLGAGGASDGLRGTGRRR